MSIHIQIERFEGPLALLLHLIRQEEMDIFDININQITQQYLDYIRAMKKLDLEVAGEFVSMAATLIHIKSRMLLPQYNEEGEEIEREDPRKELVQKLLEYQKFQEISEKLYSRPLVGRDVWLRGQRLDLSKEQDEDIVVEENPLFSLISSYRTAMRSANKTIHRVGQALQSIAERILEIRHRLVVGQKALFRDLIDNQENRLNQVLVTFLSLLELAKLGFISVFQAENFGDIHIDTKKEIDRDVVTRVEEFDTNAQQSAARAEELFGDSTTKAAEIDEAQLLNEDIPENEQIQLTLAEARPEGDEVYEVEAATDDEILAEEARLDELDGVVNAEPMLADIDVNDPTAEGGLS